MSRSCFFPLLLSVTTILIFAVTGAAQIATVTDSTCVVASACVTGPSGHGCQGVQFSVPRTGTYLFAAQIDECQQGQCADCVAEAWIVASYTPSHCIHTGCCAASTMQVTLTAGVTYWLYCCKLDCDEHGDCIACRAETCTARAKVSEP